MFTSWRTSRYIDAMISRMTLASENGIFFVMGRPRESCKGRPAGVSFKYDLIVFMALAGDDKDISRPQCGKRELQRFTTRAGVRCERCAGGTRENLSADGVRVFGAWIVIRHPNAIAEFFGNAAHDGSLARIAVASASEQHVELSFRADVRAHTAENVVQRIGSMRVVHVDCRAIGKNGGEFKAPWNGRQAGDAGNRTLDRHACAYGQTERA